MLAEIMDFFIGQRGGSLFTSPMDWLIAETWEQEGIPFPVVKGGIEETIERTKRRKRPLRGGQLTLKDCEAAVRRHFLSFQERMAGAVATEAAGAEEFEIEARLAETVAGLLERLADSLGRGSLAPEMNEKFREWLQGNLLGIGAECREHPGEEYGFFAKLLEEFDREVRVQLEHAVPEHWVAETRQQAAQLLASHRRTMPPASFEKTLEVTVDRLLRERAGLPHFRLSRLWDAGG